MCMCSYYADEDDAEAEYSIRYVVVSCFLVVCVLFMCVGICVHVQV